LLERNRFVDDGKQNGDGESHAPFILPRRRE
jgi:hypothetical protein